LAVNIKRVLTAGYTLKISKAGRNLTHTYSMCCKFVLDSFESDIQIFFVDIIRAFVGKGV